MKLRTVPHHKFPLKGENLNLALASELLRHDPAFYKIPLSDAPGIVNNAIRHGTDAARETISSYRTRDPLHLARLMGIRIVFDITNAPARPLTLLSKYTENPPLIIIYEQALRKCRENVDQWEIKSRILLSELTNICVAHELYHHLERTTLNFIDLTYRVPVLNLGFIKIEKSLRALSEISAHAYAQSLLNLPLLPCCLDPRLFEATLRRNT